MCGGLLALESLALQWLTATGDDADDAAADGDDYNDDGDNVCCDDDDDVDDYGDSICGDDDDVDDDDDG